MTVINLDDLGAVEITNRLKARLRISADQLFSQYPELSMKLSKDARAIIIEAINKKGEPKLKRAEDEIKRFFHSIKEKQSLMGFSIKEEEERHQAEELKKEDFSKSELNKLVSSQTTYDKKTGEKEGTLSLVHGTDSELVPIVICEKFESFYDFEGNLTEKEPITSGLLTIENVSNNDRLWDIDLKLKNISETSLKSDKITLKELMPTEKHEIEYNINAAVRSDLDLIEYITLDKDLEEPVHSLMNNEENIIQDIIHISNKAAIPLQGIEIKKSITPIFKNIQIQEQSIGEAKIIDENGNRFLSWKIKEISPEGEADLHINMSITPLSKNEIVRTGPITAKYTINKSLSGMEIASFDSYTNNAFNVITTELEDKPNTYECEVEFENKSDFAIRLINVDVYRPDNIESKYLDIDPDEIPPIPAKGKWTSKKWLFTAEEGVYPKFRTKIEFFTLADHQISSQIKLNYSDIELAVVSVEAQLSVNVTQIPSYQITPIKFTAMIKNIGGAVLNSILLVDNLPATFLLKEKESIELTLNAKELALPIKAIKIEPADQESTTGHKLIIDINDIRAIAKKPLEGNDEMIIRYEIIAHKPAKEMTYTSNVSLIANTLPPSKEINIDVKQVSIDVQHVRHSISRGKEILALENEGEFEITLIVKNLGESNLINYELSDRVPKDQIIWDISDKPEIKEEMNEKKLKWKIESIPPEQSKIVKYKIKPAGETSITETEKVDT